MTPPDTSVTSTRSSNDHNLEERLKTVIRQRGPICVSDFMADALYHPQEGYYMSPLAEGRKSPIGAEGDFTTAPEISQVFGEIIGLWLVQSWIDMGSPKPFNLVEFGPGRGVLMDDILRAARLRPEFIDAASIWLVETSGRLRHEQQKRLKRHTEANIQWADRFHDIAAAPTLIIANEFFDCLPINQYIWQNTGWHNRLIGLNPHNDQLQFVTAPAPTLDSDFFTHPLASRPDNPHEHKPAQEGDILEVCKPAQKLVGEIAQFLIENKGRALVIDYGPSASGFGETLQAVRDHKFWPPLSTPGRADLTAHVDFQMLGASALHEGATYYGPQAQGRFLDKLGLALRVEALCRARPEEERDMIRQGAYRLSSPGEMGELFKVICIAAPDMPAPAGFER